MKSTQQPVNKWCSNWFDCVCEKAFHLHRYQSREYSAPTEQFDFVLCVFHHSIIIIYRAFGRYLVLSICILYAVCCMLYMWHKKRNCVIQIWTKLWYVQIKWCKCEMIFRIKCNFGTTSKCMCVYAFELNCDTI